MYKLKRLSNKVFIITMFFYIVIVVLVTSWIVKETREAAEQGVVRELEILEAAFETPLAQALWSMDEDKIKSMVDGLIQLPAIDGLRVMDTVSGRALAWSGLQPQSNHTARREAGSTPLALIEYSFELYHEEGAYIDKLGEVFFYVDENVVWARIQNRVRTIVLGAFVQIIALWLVIYLVGRRVITHPLKKLTKAVDKFDLDNPDTEIQPITIPGRDELAVLGTAYSAMETRLTETFTALRDHQEHLEDLVKDRTAELESKSEKLEDAFGVISSSIKYASRIQRSVLPHDGRLDDYTSEHCVIWEPRDVVGGDIYWCEPWGDGGIIMLGDCTGHGVPGAFMTLISTGALERALLDVSEGDTGTLVTKMHQLVQLQLDQDRCAIDENCSDDGLELGVCYIPPKGQEITFSGARMPLFIEQNGTVTQIKGDKKGLGYRDIPFDFEYANNTIPVEKGMSFFMTSDGILDQVGGQKRRGYGKKRFIAQLEQLHSTPLKELSTQLLASLEEYQGDEARRDDVSFLGFRL